MMPHALERRYPITDRQQPPPDMIESGRPGGADVLHCSPRFESRLLRTRLRPVDVGDINPSHVPDSDLETPQRCKMRIPSRHVDPPQDAPPLESHLGFDFG